MVQSGEEELLSKIDAKDEEEHAHKLRQTRKSQPLTAVATSRTSVGNTPAAVARSSGATSRTRSGSGGHRNSAELRLTDWLEQRARNVCPLNETLFYSFGQLFGLMQAALGAPLDFSARFLTPGEAFHKYSYNTSITNLLSSLLINRFRLCFWNQR